MWNTWTKQLNEKQYLLTIRHGRYMVDTCRFGYIANLILKFGHLGNTSLTKFHFLKGKLQKLMNVSHAKQMGPQVCVVTWVWPRVSSLLRVCYRFMRKVVNMDFFIFSFGQLPSAHSSLRRGNLTCSSIYRQLMLSVFWSVVASCSLGSLSMQRRYLQYYAIKSYI